MRDARDRMGRGMQQCIQDCRDCQDMCAGAVQHCLRIGGMHAEAGNIRALADCAEACQTAGNFMSRESGMSARACALAAEACGACGAGCEKFAGDEEMRATAQACRRCEQSCRELAAGA